MGSPINVQYIICGMPLGSCRITFESNSGIKIRENTAQRGVKVLVDSPDDSSRVSAITLFVTTAKNRS